MVSKKNKPVLLYVTHKVFGVGPRTHVSVNLHSDRRLFDVSNNIGSMLLAEDVVSNSSPSRVLIV